MTNTVNLNTDQLQSILAVNQQQAQSIANAAQVNAISGNQFVFFAAFDGTNNDAINAGNAQTTNVNALWQQYEKNRLGNLNLGGNYYPGPGTKGTLTASSWFPPQVTQQVIQAANSAYTDFARQASNWLRGHENGSITVALASFSRGDASAAIFSQMLFERGLVDPQDNKTILIPPGQVSISAGVLFDPVTTGVNCNLAFAPNIRNIVDIQAWSEYRSAFLGADYSNQAGITPIGMYGNHCDIGGSYDNGIAAMSLQAATEFLQKSGLPIGYVSYERKFDISDFAVHNEAFDGDNKRWETYNGDGFSPNPSDRHLANSFVVPSGSMTLYNDHTIKYSGSGSNIDWVEKTQSIEGIERKTIYYSDRSSSASYLKDDGSYGTSSDDGKGSVSTSYHAADGSEGHGSDDGKGNIETTLSDSSDVETWMYKKEDGSFGVSTDDGKGNTSFFSVESGELKEAKIVRSGGINSTFSNDGEGHVNFEGRIDGLAVKQHSNPDGSNGYTLDDGKGTTVSASTDVDGSMTRTIQRADGSRGILTDDGIGNLKIQEITADGRVSDSFSELSDGRRIWDTNDGQGNLVHAVYANGTLTTDFQGPDGKQNETIRSVSGMPGYDEINHVQNSSFYDGTLTYRFGIGNINFEENYERSEDGSLNVIDVRLNTESGTTILGIGKDSVSLHNASNGEIQYVRFSGNDYSIFEFPNDVGESTLGYIFPVNGPEDPNRVFGATGYTCETTRADGTISSTEFFPDARTIGGLARPSINGAYRISTKNSDNTTLAQYELDGTELCDEVIDADGSRVVRSAAQDGVSVSKIDNLGAVSKSVDASGATSVNYFDANGNLKQWEVHDNDGFSKFGQRDEDGSETWSEYDTSGFLTTTAIWRTDGSSIKTVFGTNGGKITSEYDTYGQITTSAEKNADGSTTTYFNMDGTKSSEAWKKSDGSHGNAVYNADGSSVGTAIYADGSSSSDVDDGNGNVTTTRFNKLGRKLGDTWKKADGSQGTDVVNPDGTSSGTVTYVDGTAETSTTTSSGRSWQRSDGSHGTDIFNIDGSIVSLAYAADGSYSKAIDDGHGSVTTERFDKGGIKLSVSWKSSDGAQRAEVFNSDGSVSGTVTYADGVTETYARSSTGKTWQRSDGSHGTDIFNADGSSAGTAVLANGLTETYSSSGTTRTWQRTDGSHGTSTFGGDGSTSSISYASDGSYSTAINDGHGNVMSVEFDTDGVKLRDTWKRADGSNGTDSFSSDGSSSGTAEYANGVMETSNRNSSGKTWQRSDGTHGTDTFNVDGSSSGTTIFANGVTETYVTNSTSRTWQRSDGSHGSDIFSTDGSVTRLSYEIDGAHTEIDDSGHGDVTTIHFSKDGVKLDETWVKSDGSSGNGIYYADGSGTKTWKMKDGTYGRIVNNGMGSIASLSFDLAGGSTNTYQNEDGSAGVEIFNAYGILIESSKTYADGTTSHFKLDADGSSSETAQLPDGQYSIELDDGQGNTVSSQFHADGTKFSETWEKSDGSHGRYLNEGSGYTVSDVWNADGSGTETVRSDPTSEGFTSVSVSRFKAAGERDGYSTTITDAEGNALTTQYDNDGIQQGMSWLKADGTAGTGDGGYSTSLTDDAGKTTITQFNFFGVKTSDSWTTVDGSTGTSTFNDDGTTSKAWWNGDGTYGTLEDDGQGNTDSVTYDANGQLIKEIWTQSDGLSGIDTCVYDSLGNLLEEVWSQSDGMYGKNDYTFDSTGSMTGESWELSDGTHGFSVYNQDGSRSITKFEADGSYSTYSDDGQGNSITIQFDKEGIKLSDTWRKADGSEGSDTFDHMNQAPALVTPISAQTANEAKPFSFVVPSDSFTDPDPGDSLAFQASLADGSALPSWLSFDAATKTLQGTPGHENVGAVDIRITAVDDGGLQVSSQFMLTVAAVSDQASTETDAAEILVGGAGDDVLENASGDNKLFDGRAGNDALIGGSGNEMFIGGADDDRISTGAGANIIAFNRGDGQDTVEASIGADNTISLGGGIRYEDLALRKSSNDLILETGDAEQITLKDWYASTENHDVQNLQVILDATSDYDPNSTDSLLNKQVEEFDFAGLVDRFDQALSGTPTLTRWALTSSLLDMHLSGSDADALGGDLAYQYGQQGTLSGLSISAAQGIINHSQFGVATQSLQSAENPQGSTTKLG